MVGSPVDIVGVHGPFEFKSAYPGREIISTPPTPDANLMTGDFLNDEEQPGTVLLTENAATILKQRLTDQQHLEPGK